MPVSKFDNDCTSTSRIESSSAVEIFFTIPIKKPLGYFPPNPEVKTLSSNNIFEFFLKFLISNLFCSPIPSRIIF